MKKSILAGLLLAAAVVVQPQSKDDKAEKAFRKSLVLSPCIAKVGSDNCPYGPIDAGWMGNSY